MDASTGGKTSRLKGCRYFRVRYLSRNGRWSDIEVLPEGRVKEYVGNLLGYLNLYELIVTECDNEGEDLE